MATIFNDAVLVDLIVRCIFSLHKARPNFDFKSQDVVPVKLDPTRTKLVLKMEADCPPFENTPHTAFLIFLRCGESIKKRKMYLEDLARDVLGEDLVPRRHVQGEFTPPSHGRISYSVHLIQSAAVPLEPVWDRLGWADRRNIMREVVQAMEKAQKVRLDLAGPSLMWRLDEMLPGTTEPMEVPVGEVTQNGDFNPEKSTEPLDDAARMKRMLDLLEAFIQRGRRIKTRVSKTGMVLPVDGFTGEQVDFSTAEIKTLCDNLLLCHSGLEPRNILVRQEPTMHGLSSTYKLAAIFDWDDALFCPAPFVLAHKDMQLGAENLNPSWYQHFRREALGALLPQNPAGHKLFKIAGVLYRFKASEHPVHFEKIQQQDGWVAGEKLEYVGIQQGWVNTWKEFGKLKDSVRN